MDLTEAETYAATWAADWNSHDPDRILAHYTEDVTWASPGIVRYTGDSTGELHGKAALREYFATAMKQLPDLHFVVEHVRASVNSIVIGYRNEQGREVSEVLTFKDGLITQGFGAYGPAPQP